MTYATDPIAATLKRAREAKGLSQRALGDLAGVPQSHISKIESGGVDLRVSSLVELARVLGLELTLVPRKSVPAVNSIVRSTSDAPREPKPSTRKAWRNIRAELDKLSHADPTSTELAQLQRLARDVEYFGLAGIDRETLRDVNKRIDAILEKRDADGVHRVLIEMRRLRNAAVHGMTPDSTDVRSAYSLEGGDDGE